MANQTENAAEVIGKDGRSKPSTVDESRGLEYVFVLISDLLCTLRVIRGDILGIRILTFVDLEQFIGNILRR